MYRLRFMFLPVYCLICNQTGTGNRGKVTGKWRQDWRDRNHRAVGRYVLVAAAPITTRTTRAASGEP